jgi:hypothetical protein
MSLTVGSRLGPYEILALIGAESWRTPVVELGLDAMPPEDE